MDNPGYDYVVEPTLDTCTLLSPKTGFQPVLSFVNCGDRNVKIHKGQLVGLAYEIDDEVEKLTQETVKISQTSVTTDTNELEIGKVPNHLIDLYNRSIYMLFLDQGQQHA